MKPRHLQRGKSDASGLSPSRMRTANVASVSSSFFIQNSGMMIPLESALKKKVNLVRNAKWFWIYYTFATVVKILLFVRFVDFGSLGDDIF